MVRHDRPWQVADVGQLADAYGRQLDDAVKWLHRRPNFSVLETDYYRVLEQPEVVVQDVNRFLDGRLDVVAMVQVPDPSLYRVRVENGDLALAGG
jgi:hypothetical protein